MIRYECDKCGTRMNPDDAHRFIVKMEIYAAASHVDLETASGDAGPGALDRVIESLRHADPDEIEDKTYRAYRFDVCDDCRRLLMANPLDSKA